MSDGAFKKKRDRRNLLYALALSCSMLVRVACMEVCFFGSVRCMNNARTALVNVQREVRDLQFRWCLRLVETVSGGDFSKVFWKATDRAPSFELSIVRIGLETTELQRTKRKSRTRGRGETPTRAAPV